MSSNISTTVNKGLPYFIGARAPGKWDSGKTQIFSSDNQTATIAMEDYAGLSNSELVHYQSPDELNFSSTILPWKWDYSSLLNITNYCLMPVGTNYENIKNTKHIYHYNFSITGSPTINNQNGTITNFSQNNYITYSYSPAQDSFEYITKFKTGSSVTSQHQGILYDTTTSRSLIIVKSSGALSSYINGSWVDGSYTLSTNTTYWIRLVVTEKVLQCYVSVYNNEEYCPATSDMTLSFTVTSDNTFISHGLRTGVANNSEAIIGYIYYIDTSFWEGATQKWNWGYSETRAEKSGNVLYPGTSDSDGIMSGFSSTTNKTTQIPTTITIYKDKPFLGQFRVYTEPSSNRNSCHFIRACTSNDDGNTGMLFYLRSNASNNSYYGVFKVNGSERYSSTTLSYSTWYYFRIRYNPTAVTEQGKSYSAHYVYWEYSTNGTSWTTIHSYNLSSYWMGDTPSATQSTIYLFVGASLGLAFTGSIDFKESYFTVDGTEVWNGAKDKLITLPGCTYNYTDTGAATTLNCFAVGYDQSIVLTPDSTYTDGWLLGQVSIPAHDVYAYNDGTWTKVTE